MNRDQTKAKKWTCNQCGVLVSRIDGEATALPDSWARSADGLFCLSCRRERAADAALKSTASSSLADRARLRRTGLIEFEIRRTPDHSNGVIAKACRTSVLTVAQTRSRLRIPAPPPASGTQAKHREPANR